MKQTIIMLLLFICNSSIGQRSTVYNDNGETERITKAFIGTWTHIESIYPSGVLDNSWYEHTFRTDSTSLARKIIDGDTIELQALWFAVDTNIYLYTVLDTTVLFSGFVAVNYLEKDSFSVTRIWGNSVARKTAIYIRKED